MLPKTAAPRIIVLNADPLQGALIRRQIHAGWKRARVEVCRDVGAAVRSIETDAADLFITDVCVEDMAGLVRLAASIQPDLPLLVVTGRRDSRAFRLLKELHVDGIFDVRAEGLGKLQPAIDDAMDRQLYVSSSVVPHLAGG